MSHRNLLIKMRISSRGIPYAYTVVNGVKKLVKLNKLKMRTVSNGEEVYIIYNGDYKEDDNIIMLVPTDSRAID